MSFFPSILMAVWSYHQDKVVCWETNSTRLVVSWTFLSIVLTAVSDIFFEVRPKTPCYWAGLTHQRFRRKQQPPLLLLLTHFRDHAASATESSQCTLMQKISKICMTYYYSSLIHISCIIAVWQHLQLIWILWYGKIVTVIIKICTVSSCIFDTNNVGTILPILLVVLKKIITNGFLKIERFN